MLVEIKVPVLSESVAEATLLTWHKKEGERVERDENLIDIETDKVVLELPAPASGTLAKIAKADGATVAGSEVIGTIDTDTTTTTKPPSRETANSPRSESSKNKPVSAPSPDQSANAADPSIFEAAMPAARKLAAREGLGAKEISSIKGSGRGGRITKEDVSAHVNEKSPLSRASSPAPEAPAESFSSSSGNRPEQRVAMTRLRARIAERLVQSQSTAAILTTFNEVNMQAIMELRTRHKEKFEQTHGVKLGLTSFFVKAVVAALKKFPIINASVDDGHIIYHGYYDIGIAISSPRGLVVPIIQDADSLSLAEIEKQVMDLGQRARNGKLTIEELTGGTFSITNGGVFGSMLSTPIINPPQSAILGVHATKDRPVAENGQVVIRPISYLALSYDHRIIDGREAVLSLGIIKEALEFPMSPSLEL